MTAIQTVIAGLFGTCFMTLIMGLIHRAGWANGDMIRAVGSLATRSTRGAVGAGVSIHFASGVMFAFPYTFLLGVLAPQYGAGAVTAGLMLGLFHGIIVSFLILAFVSDKHPIEKFRGAGLDVAAAHLAGHVGYGFGVAVVYSLLRIQWGA
jgi:hypothetical protein